MRESEISKALRAERREDFEKVLKDNNRSEWREYIANKQPALVETPRSDITGY